MDDAQQLLKATAAMLRFQAELGLRGANVPKQWLQGESEVPAASMMEASGLAGIRDALGDCRRCALHQRRTHIVFGVGNPDARLMFIGEGPGRDEDLKGEPFVGPAGQLLNQMIVAMGMRREQVYIANIIKCRPLNNRDPMPDEVAACIPFLKRQIRSIAPEIIVGLGRYAVQTLLDLQTPISRLRGKWNTYGEIALMPTFHPAYLLRNPKSKQDVWQDLQQVMARLGLPNPNRQQQASHEP